MRLTKLPSRERPLMASRNSGTQGRPARYGRRPRGVNAPLSAGRLRSIEGRMKGVPLPSFWGPALLASTARKVEQLDPRKLKRKVDVIAGHGLVKRGVQIEPFLPSIAINLRPPGAPNSLPPRPVDQLRQLLRLLCVARYRSGGLRLLVFVSPAQQQCWRRVRLPALPIGSRRRLAAP